MKYNSVQALRGLACLTVALFHLSDVERRMGLGQNPLKPLLWFGYSGVDLFFVISGFIIATVSRSQFGQPRQLPTYLFRRFWRIYPVFWLVFALGFWFDSVLHPQPYYLKNTTDGLLRSAFLLPHVFPPLFVGVAWTLAFEIIFYTAVALLVVLPKRIAAPFLAAWGGAVVALWASGWMPTNVFLGTAFNPYIVEFLLGCCVAFTVDSLKRWQATAVWAAAASWLGTGLWLTWTKDFLWLGVHPVERVCVFGPPYALLLYGLIGRERAGTRISFPRLQTLGDASYSIYLLHGLLLGMGMHWSGKVDYNQGKIPHAIWLMLMTTLMIVPSLTFHRWVEKPLMNLFKKPPRVQPVALENSNTPLRRAA